MAALLFLAWFIAAPAFLTRMFVRYFLSRNPTASRGRTLRTCVPAAAVLPLLPLTTLVAVSDEIYNPVLIAIMATAMGAVLVGLLVCLPVGLAMTRD